MPKPKRKKDSTGAAAAPLTSAHHNRERGLAYYHKVLGNKAMERIYAYLEKNPMAAVLDIGCGDGNALAALKEKFPEATFYGLDHAEEPENTGNDTFEFTQHNIEEPLPKNLKGKFDILISVATLPYVGKKREALLNIHNALKPNGFACIASEALYFGPYGPRIFDSFKGEAPFTWDADLRRIMIKNTGKKFPQGSLMPDFYCYELPKELKVEYYEYQDCGKKLIGFEANLSAEEKNKHLRQLEMLEHKDTILRGTGPYYAKLADGRLKVEEFNPNGAGGAGREGFRPYRFAAPSVYMRRPGMRKGDLIRLLRSPDTYEHSLLSRPEQPKLEEASGSSLNCSSSLFMATAAVAAAAVVIATKALPTLSAGDGNGE